MSFLKLLNFEIISQLQQSCPLNATEHSSSLHLDPPVTSILLRCCITLSLYQYILLYSLGHLRKKLQTRFSSTPQYSLCTSSQGHPLTLLRITSVQLLRSGNQHGYNATFLQPLFRVLRMIPVTSFIILARAQERMLPLMPVSLVFLNLEQFLSLCLSQCRRF